MDVTRLAPSPTGALHLGNARTFLVNWLLARQRGWRVLLRMEDLDGPRVKKGADRQAIDDLRWLGIDYDTGPIYQSTRMNFYSDAVARLLKAGLAYPCTCTRSEVAASASAPHADDGAAIYPGTCRDRYADLHTARQACGRDPAIRFRTSSQIVEINDGFAGIRRFDVERDLGDFVIAKGDGTPAYQLAVVVDDAQMGITQIVRGDDLLDSTPRQILLYRALGIEQQAPHYFHLPLVVGTDGRRLAKRHGDTRIASYRDAGVRPERLLGLLARWLGVDAEQTTASALLKRFDLAKLPRERVVFTPQDDRWLKGAA